MNTSAIYSHVVIQSYCKKIPQDEGGVRTICYQLKTKLAMSLTTIPTCMRAAAFQRGDLFRKNIFERIPSERSRVASTTSSTSTRQSSTPRDRLIFVLFFSAGSYARANFMKTSSCVEDGVSPPRTPPRRTKAPPRLRCKDLIRQIMVSGVL